MPPKRGVRASKRLVNARKTNNLLERLTTSMEAMVRISPLPSQQQNQDHLMFENGDSNARILQEKNNELNEDHQVNRKDTDAISVLDSVIDLQRSVPKGASTACTKNKSQSARNCCCDNNKLGETLEKLLKIRDSPNVSIPKIKLNSNASDFDAWMTALVYSTETNNWNEKQICDSIRQSIEADLRDAMMTMKSSASFYYDDSQTLCSTVKDLLLRKPSTITQGTEVDNCRQQASESVKDYFFRKCKIINTSFGEIGDAVKIAFITSGLNETIRRKVISMSRLEEHMTLSRYLKVLEEVEQQLPKVFNSFKQDNNSQRQYTNYRQYNQYRENAGNFSSYQKFERNKIPFQQERQFKPYTDYPKNFAEDQRPNENKPPNFQQTEHFQQNNSGNPQTNTFQRSQAVEPKTNNYQKQRKRIACGVCGKTNHSTGDCNGDQKAENSNARGVQNPITENSFIVRFPINGYMVNAVVDTGADKSMMNLEIAQKCQLKIEPFTANLIASNKQRMAINSKTTACFKFYTVEVTCEFALLDELSADALLGIDFFRKYNIVVDPSFNCLWHRNNRKQFIKWNLPRIKLFKETINKEQCVRG